MGTWGTGLYQSDVAADVRTVYRDCKKLGFSGGDFAAIVLETVGGRIGGQRRRQARAPGAGRPAVQRPDAAQGADRWRR